MVIHNGFLRAANKSLPFQARLLCQLRVRLPGMFPHLKRVDPWAEESKGGVLSVSPHRRGPKHGRPSPNPRRQLEHDGPFAVSSRGVSRRSRREYDVASDQGCPWAKTKRFKEQHARVLQYEIEDRRMAHERTLGRAWKKMATDDGGGDDESAGGTAGGRAGQNPHPTNALSSVASLPSIGGQSKQTLATLQAENDRLITSLAERHVKAVDAIPRRQQRGRQRNNRGGGGSKKKGKAKRADRGSHQQSANQQAKIKLSHDDPRKNDDRRHESHNQQSQPGRRQRQTNVSQENRQQQSKKKKCPADGPPSHPYPQKQQLARTGGRDGSGNDNRRDRRDESEGKRVNPTTVSFESRGHDRGHDEGDGAGELTDTEPASPMLDETKVQRTWTRTFSDAGFCTKPRRDEQKEQQQKQQAQSLCSAAVPHDLAGSPRTSALRVIFKTFDENGDGILEKHEILNALKNKRGIIQAVRREHLSMDGLRFL